MDCGKCNTAGLEIALQWLGSNHRWRRRNGRAARADCTQGADMAIAAAMIFRRPYAHSALLSLNACLCHLVPLQ